MYSQQPHLENAAVETEITQTKGYFYQITL